jgi:hypothetical protein
MAADGQEHPGDTPAGAYPAAARDGAPHPYPFGSSLVARTAAREAAQAAVRAGASGPDWDALPVPPDVRERWRAVPAEDPTDPSARSHDRIGQETRRQVALLEAAVPGVELADWLDRVDPDALPSAVMVEAVAAAGRVEAWAHARTARWAARLATCPEMDPQWSRLAGPPPAQRSVAGDELAIRMATSRLAANRLVREGVAYDQTLQATGVALASGDVDPARARLLVDRLADLPWQVATAVEDRVLPDAGRRTLAQLEGDVAAALLEVDAHGAQHREDAARAARRVGRPRAMPDGMASMSLLLPAEDALRVDGVLQHAAAAAKNLGDERTLDQLRADGLRDLVVGAPAVPDASDAATGSDSAPPVPGLDPLAPGPRPGVTIWVTVSADTLLDLDDRPAHLEGYGPVAATRARALAAGGTWRRLITDPASGAVLDVGRTRYRPPTALAEHVRLRDKTCVRPGCTLPARHAELDHTRGYRRRPGDPPGTPLGTTSADNVAPLCHRDHRLKTDGGHTLHQYAPGRFQWVTPTGHTYRTRPGTDDTLCTTTRHPDAGPPPF